MIDFESGEDSAQTTPERIYAAAKRRFVTHSYETATLRMIANDAGVDVALIARYFGSKEGLFREVLKEMLAPDSLVVEDRESFGERCAAMMFDVTGDPEEGNSFRMIVNAAASPAAGPILREVAKERFIGPFAAWLGGENAELRAHLISSLLTGMHVLRHGSDQFERSPGLAEAYIKEIGIVLQGWIDDHA